MLTASSMLDDAALAKLFVSDYGRAPRLFSAPGRVNLIGDHTDYNDGFALPVAIGHRTVVAGAVRSDRKFRVRSLPVGEVAEFDLDRPALRRPSSWLDYVEGVARSLERDDTRLAGADLLVDSDVPLGAGLSSSAALEMSLALALTSLSDKRMAPLGLALAAQAAEHDYVGTRCGIMDQIVAALGRPDRALLIDSRSLETKEVPCVLRGACIVLCDTKVKHELAASAYNERRHECETSVARLRAVRPEVHALRDVSMNELPRHAEMLGERLYRRCRHVVSENARTLSAVHALQNDDFAALGHLMQASHVSLRDDYEVSCPELDLCVDIAMTLRGAYGSRMTGGGFGGCTVTVVEEGAVSELTDALLRGFEQRFQRRPDVFTVRPAEGMKEHDRLYDD
jgi:galactokinase